MVWNLLFAGWFDSLNPVKWVNYLIKGAFKGVKRFFCWLLLQCLGWCDSFLGYLLSFLPSPPAWTADIVNWYGMLNAWFPIDAVIWCSMSYFTYLAVIASYRFIKSWIPTIGG